MIWLGLTGGIATGKSTAAKLLRKMGLKLIDADEVSRHVVRAGSPGLHQILQAFGPALLLPDQSLDRKKMAQLVFNDKAQLQKLESILHPLIKSEVASRKSIEEKKGTALLVYDVPLLFEKNLQNQFDSTILIACNEKLQNERMRSRDQMSDSEIESRLKNQMPLAQKRKLAKFVIENDSSLESLETQLRQTLEKIKKQY